MSAIASDELPIGHVSISLLRAVVDVLQQRGVPPEGLLQDAADSFANASPTAKLPLARYQALLTHAAELACEPALALQCGLQAAESSFGLIGPLCSHAPCLRRAIELVVRFQPLLLDDSHLYITERMGVATLRCEFPHSHEAADRHLAELIVAGLYRTVRAFGCARSDIHAVCFEHARPAYHHAYTAAFSGKERFACTFTGLEFSAQVLDRPHIHWQPELEELLHAEAERVMERMERPMSAAEHVLASMRRQRPGDAPEMARVARELGISVRSLRRRLTEEGTSFRDLTQTLLQETACAMLRDPNVTPQGIAHALGFAHTAAFRRAFKRWTQQTPAEYRDATRRGQVAQLRAAHGA